jgi:hypothetical protein
MLTLTGGAGGMTVAAGSRSFMSWLKTALRKTTLVRAPVRVPTS